MSENPASIRERVQKFLAEQEARKTGRPENAPRVVVHREIPAKEMEAWWRSNLEETGTETKSEES